MKKLLLPIASLVLVAGCAMKTKVMDASVVSMTHANLPKGSKMKETGPVSGTFCADSFHDKGAKGLFDEAVTAAQKQHDVDFITNATFWRDEHGCIILEGTGQKLVADGVAPTALKPTAKKK